MVRRISKLTALHLNLHLFVLVALFAIVGSMVQAQHPPMPAGGPDMGDEGPPAFEAGEAGGPTMGPMPNMGPRGFGGMPGATGHKFFGRPGLDRRLRMSEKGEENQKEIEAKRERQRKNQILRTTAEAHKNLADLYASQDKIDQAIAELRKILDLTNQVDDEERDRLGRQIGLVYMEMAELLIKKDRLDEAKKVLSEGADKLKSSQPEVAARMYLNLGDIFRKKGNDAQAESAYKQAIEISTGALENKSSDKKK